MKNMKVMKQRCLNHYASAKWVNPRCDSLISHGIDCCLYIHLSVLRAWQEVNASGLKLYILHTFFNSKVWKPWFNSACCCAVKDRAVAHRRYCSHPSHKTHILYISIWNPICSFASLSFLESILNKNISNIYKLTIFYVIDSMDFTEWSINNPLPFLTLSWISFSQGLQWNLCYGLGYLNWVWHKFLISKPSS